MSSNGWRTVKLGELCEVTSSKRIFAREYVSDGIPFFRGKEIIEKHKGGDITTELFISNEKFKDISRHYGVPQKGDILLTSVGTLGIPWIVGEEEFYFKDGNITWIKEFGVNLLNQFLYYWILSPLGKGEIGKKTIGSTQQALTIQAIKSFDIELPIISEQKAIATTLSCLDDMIELNNRTNEILKEMAQAIFKRWFVDFEFPNEVGEPYKSSGGEMVESELGEIPKGWSVVRLNEIAEVCIGGDWGKDRETENLVQVICLRGTDLQSLKEAGYANEAPIRWVKKDSIAKREIQDNEILIGGSGLGPIGRSLYCATGIKEIYNYPIIYSNFCKKIRAISREYAIFAEHVIERKYKSGEMQNFVSGTSIPNLDIAGLLNSVIVLPNHTVINRFADIKQNYFENKFKKTNIVLGQIRDTLLPKLMSGEIRVPIEEVV